MLPPSFPSSDAAAASGVAMIGVALMPQVESVHSREPISMLTVLRIPEMQIAETTVEALVWHPMLCLRRRRQLTSQA